MKPTLTMIVTGLVLGTVAAHAQTTPGSASTSGDPAASTTQTGLAPVQSQARPSGGIQPPNAMSQAINTSADPHTGRNNPTGTVPSRNKSDGN